MWIGTRGLQRWNWSKNNGNASPLNSSQSYHKTCFPGYLFLIVIFVYQFKFTKCYLWSRNWLPSLSTRVHPQFLVGFMLLDLLFSVSCFIDRFLSFFSFGHCDVLRFTDSNYPFGIFKLFLWAVNWPNIIYGL
jgi:hypothetical protein